MAMLTLKLLCIISFQIWVQGETDDVTQALCTDKDVEGAVDLALVEYNKKLQYGNQVALYRILKAQKVNNESGTVFAMDFQTREADCPVGGDKIWRDCHYLLTPAKVPSVCNATVYKSTLEEIQEVLSVSCIVTDETIVVRKHAHCLGCREVIDPASDDIKEPLAYSLAKFNTIHNSEYHFVLNEINSATRQVVSGFRYDIQFDVAKSNCSKTDFTEVTDECHPTAEDKEFAHCNSTVYVAPWRHEEPEAHVDCAPGLHMGVFIQRRPPGWSPLSLPHPEDAVASPSPPASSSEHPKQHSSEESQKSTMASSTLPQSNIPEVPTSEPAAEPQRPFNCPSEPWKSDDVPTSPSPSPAVQLSPEAGHFSDLDLL